MGTFVFEYLFRRTVFVEHPGGAQADFLILFSVVQRREDVYA